jgi:biopolymer transport protein ExbB
LSARAQPDMVHSRVKQSNCTMTAVLSSLLRRAAIAMFCATLVAMPASVVFAQEDVQPVEQATPAQTLAPTQVPTEAIPVSNDGPVQVSTLPHNLSPLGMFMAADWVVKAVMIGLALASLATWTIWLAKSIELATAKRTLSSALDRIVEARSLEEAGQQFERKRGGAAALLVRAAGHEAALSAPLFVKGVTAGASAGLKERVASHLGRIEAQAARRMTRGTGVLASIGSVAPFVGLFGTVWGIMNSFIGISQAQTTNLAIVAPGIAEALLATAIGLVAAIPAVVIYNAFARSIAGYKLLLGDTSAAVERLVSRDLDRRAAGLALQGSPSFAAQAAE